MTLRPVPKLIAERVCRDCTRASPAVIFRSPSAKFCITCNRRRLAERRARRWARGEANPPVKRAVVIDEGLNAKHLRWIRQQPCAVQCGACVPRMHAHHVRTNTMAGIGRRPPDAWAIPLCALHHMEGHRIGWRTFEARYRIDLIALAIAMARLSPVLSLDQRGKSEIPYTSHPGQSMEDPHELAAQ